MNRAFLFVILILLPFSLNAQTVSTISQPICTFNRNLQVGFKGEGVKNLQTILNINTQTQVAKVGAGSSKNETTFFGAATRAAVIKFQELYAKDILIPSGLAKGNGFVRAFTREKLKEVCMPAPAVVSLPVTTNANATATASVTTTTVINQVVQQIYAGGGTPTYDAMPPVISQISVTPISDTSVIVTWTTDESGNSLVEYGTSASYGLSTIDTAFVTAHSVTLTGLTASTTYHFRLKSADVLSNVRTSSDQVFTTFVGLMDSYSNLYAVHATKRVLTSYSGPLYRIRRDSDNATMDVTPTATGWPNNSAISTWLAGANAYVTTVYDQSGNARNLIQTTVIKQPSLNLSGTQAVFEFDGGTQELAGATTMNAFSQNIGAASVVMVRRHDIATVTDRVPFFVSTPSGATRMTMGISATLGTDSASGRRTDADSIQRSNGFSINTNWATEIGRWDWSTANLYHQRDGESEIKSSFQTAGNSQNSTSTIVTVGAASTNSYFSGQISMIGWVRAKLTDTEVNTMVNSLSELKATTTQSTNGQFLSWGSTALTGTYTLAPGLTNYTAFAPSGATVTEADLDSHRYHHHTRIAVQNGRVWVAFTSSGTNEDGSGQLTVVKSSPDGGSTWSTTTVAVGSQSTFAAAGASYVNGSRITYPRSFVKYNGELYLVTAVDDVTASNNLTGSALLANKMNDDGTVGTVFRISTENYTPQSGFPTINYDATLGPALFASAALYGNWGGSSIGNTPSSWTGWITQYGENFTEPTTIDLNVSGTALVRLWRKTTTTFVGFNSLWSQRSSNGGATWSPLSQTTIPNSPSSATGIRLPDGRIVLVGNPRDVTNPRDPLYIALFNGTTGVVNNVYAVRQGLSANPVFPGTFKSGVIAYPDVAFDGTNLWVSYSIHKEDIGVTKIPLGGL
ncbi:MAG: exo-alpha-sialidase [Patescibacteria group bacterium]